MIRNNLLREGRDSTMIEKLTRPFFVAVLNSMCRKSNTGVNRWSECGVWVKMCLWSAHPRLPTVRTLIGVLVLSTVLGVADGSPLLCRALSPAINESNESRIELRPEITLSLSAPLNRLLVMFGVSALWRKDRNDCACTPCYMWHRNSKTIGQR